MTQETRRRKWRWLRHVAWVLGAKVFLIVTGFMIFFGSGAGNPLLSRLLMSRLERMTGGKVELRALSIRWLAMRATIKGLVIHGREPAGTEPLFTAEEVQAGLRIDSFWGRRISLSELVVQQPHVHIRVGKSRPPLRRNLGACRATCAMPAAGPWRTPRSPFTFRDHRLRRLGFLGCRPRLRTRTRRERISFRLLKKAITLSSAAWRTSRLLAIGYISRETRQRQSISIFRPD